MANRGAALGHGPTLAASEGPAGIADTPMRLGERYEILGLLGTGGMGSVYKARDLELDELVALKLLRPEIVGSPGMLERFRREVKLARRVTHPNVARVFDIGERGGERILTMELVDGEPLSRLIERRSIDVPRAVEIARAVCAGVGAAHAVGVVHRDLKPDNVLVAKDGRVVVADFGIALALAASRSALTGGIVGTPLYMAPEQIEGSANVDERTDVYALGAMLFEMLTGEPPFTGESPLAVAAARLLREPPDPRSRRPGLSPDLAAITLRCLARSRDGRFPTMQALSDALATASASDGASSVPAPRPEVRARSGAKRVAVLPFRNVGPPEADYVADALTEDLIDILGASPGLRVQSRGVVMALRGQLRDPRELGRELGADVVVEGTVRSSPGAFRISARLISVDDGFQIWSQRFDGKDGEQLALNDAVSRAVAEALTVDAPEGAPRAAADAEAVDLYLRARAQHHLFHTSDPRASVTLFEQALARWPDNPRILAGWVMARARVPFTRPGEHDELRSAAERAVRIAPSLADVHTAIAAVHGQFGEPARAILCARRALRLSEASAESHDLIGRFLSEADRDEAVAHLEAALAAEPSFEFAQVALARHHALRLDWERVKVLLERPTSTPVTPALARTVFWMKDVERAAELLRALPQASMDTRPVLVVTRCLLEVTVGQPPPDDDALRLPPSGKRRPATFLAQIRTEVAAASGQHERALRALTEADALGLFDVSWMDRCPVLEPLCADRVFREVRARAGTRATAVVEAYLAPTEA